jgi:hypothetical protein
MCKARLQAVGQPKPGPIRPGQAGPRSGPDEGLGPAWNFPKPQAGGPGRGFWPMTCSYIYDSNKYNCEKKTFCLYTLALKSHAPTSSESSRATTCHLRNRFPPRCTWRQRMQGSFTTSQMVPSFAYLSSSRFADDLRQAKA